MKTTKKVFYVTSIVIACAVMSFMFWLSSWIRQYAIHTAIHDILMAPSTLGKYSERWDISFPEDATVTYNFSCRDGFHGDGEKYCVIKFQSRPEEFLKEFCEGNREEYEELYEKITSRLLNSGMDKTKLVIPNDVFLYKIIIKDNNKLLLLYDENTNTVYYFESLM